MWTTVLVVGVAVSVLVAWPLLHGKLLAEAVRVFTGERAELDRVVAAVILTPLAVFAVGLGVGCVGGFLPSGLSFAGSLAVGVLVRAACYAGFLRIPALGALGLSVGVTLISSAVGSALIALLVAQLWLSGALG